MSMKKYLLLLLAATTSMCALATENHSLEEIRDQWTSRNIKVPKGGENPNIVQLLTAFQNAWGTYVIDPVLRCAKDPRFTSKKDEETDGEIIVDRKNGYACLDNGGTDSGYMETCVWRRNNGHRLFAIVLGQPVDPEIDTLSARKTTSATTCPERVRISSLANTTSTFKAISTMSFPGMATSITSHTSASTT